MKFKTKLFIIISGIIVTLAIVHLGFYFLQVQQANISINSIKVLLRQEISSSNNFLISRTIADLEESKLIKCSKLINSQTQEIFSDFSFRSKCKNLEWLLDGQKVNINLKSLNGNPWQIEYTSVNGDFFYISLWLTRILLATVVTLTILFLFQQNEFYQTEEKKKIKMKELAAQAAHDIASPISLLNAISATDLVSDDVKDLLNQVGERVQGIVGNLKNQSNKIELNLPNGAESVDLDIVIKKILKEYITTNNRISYVSTFEKCNVIANANDLMRLISNILNNSIEATTSRQNNIEIKVTQLSEKFISLTISDTGSGINPEIINKLGSKGATFGKPSGQGLGLYHARECVLRWGGQFEINSTLNKGTSIQISLQATISS